MENKYIDQFLEGLKFGSEDIKYIKEKNLTINQIKDIRIQFYDLYLKNMGLGNLQYVGSETEMEMKKKMDIENKIDQLLEELNFTSEDIKFIKEKNLSIDAIQILRENLDNLNVLNMPELNTKDSKLNTLGNLKPIGPETAIEHDKNGDAIDATPEI